jgi:hypothetical protein
LKPIFFIAAYLKDQFKNNEYEAFVASNMALFNVKPNSAIIIAISLQRR